MRAPFLQLMVLRGRLACREEHSTSVRRSITSVEPFLRQRGTSEALHHWGSRGREWSVPQRIITRDCRCSAADGVGPTSSTLLWSKCTPLALFELFDPHRTVTIAPRPIPESDPNFFIFYSFSISFSLLPNYPSFIFKSQMCPFSINPFFFLIKFFFNLVNLIKQLFLI